MTHETEYMTAFITSLSHCHQGGESGNRLAIEPEVTVLCHQTENDSNLFAMVFMPTDSVEER